METTDHSSPAAWVQQVFGYFKASAGITDRMLSKELRKLEQHQLVKRSVYDTFPVTGEYTMTEYGETLKDVIRALHIWGGNHRRKFFGSDLSRVPVNKDHLG